MFIKYEKTFRLNVPEFDIGAKLTLSRKEARRLLGAEVTVEEKIDGANTGIIRHKGGFSLQKRGSLVGQSEHEQFGRFHAWAWQEKYDNIMSIPKGCLVYGEWAYAQHHIYYDRLPDYFLVFDVLKNGKFFNRDQRTDFCGKYGFCQVPLIAQGYFTVGDLMAMMPKVSAFGDRAEGMVIKRYRKKEYMRAKLVWPEFVKELDESEHWTRKQLSINKLEVK
jgi:ATP-dependent RNA circularization protein (DNA/RNA ligase family)